MKIFHNPDNIKINNPVATIGIFDGVHLGHKEIIYKIKNQASKINGETLVITLWPPPRQVFNRSGKPVTFLSTLEEKIQLLQEAGVDNLLIIPFSKEFAQTSYNSFIKNILVEKIHIKKIVVGFNHTFGKNREGNFEKLLESAKIFGFEAEQLVPVLVNNKPVSSSLVREMVIKGKVDQAGSLLGYDYSVEGTVMDGNKIGKSLGFPTANIHENNPEKLIPKNGVYAVEVVVESQQYSGMLNIGVRPTIKEQDHRKTIEVNIFDFNRSIYGQKILIRFKKRIRDEINFSDFNQLIGQLHKDKKEIQQYFGGKHGS
ncbi:MAG: bifunctional riboflavin kinase/FAD synthetase [Bacteroidales bacterium]|nr:bifunctional riboflavin kinase/FAD synthetase [Bacteroidales bacterium]